MIRASYTLSSRQIKDMALGVIRVAIPIPPDWPVELYDAPDGSVDLVDWAAESLGVSPQQIGAIGSRAISYAPGSRVPGLTGLLGRIVQPDEAVALWTVRIGCVVCELRGDRTIRPKPGPIAGRGIIGAWIMSATMWYDAVSADEVIAEIDGGDGLGYACDWLSGRHGVELDGSYSEASIRAAVLANDPDLLEVA